MIISNYFRIFAPENHLIVMDYDILQSVSQGGDGAQDAENSRIAAIADELERLCAIYEAQCRVGQTDVTHFDAEQRAAEQMHILLRWL